LGRRKPVATSRFSRIEPTGGVHVHDETFALVDEVDFKVRVVEIVDDAAGVLLVLWL
jgi:hypothetical protein